MGPQYRQTFLDRITALTTIKGLTASTLDLIGRFGTTLGSPIDLGGINIIANAMDHIHYLLQLRMIVNFNKQ